MTTKRIIAGNWKMNLLGREAADHAARILEASKPLARSEVWVAPPFTAIAAAAAVLKGSAVRCGGQNAHWEACGAFTGEISVPMLQELGCTFCITGHSERRHIMGETNDLVVKRTLGVLKTGFTVILCIGEKLSEREEGRTNAVLEAQLGPVLAAIAPGREKQLVIAYEPVWAIGTGKVATVKEIEEAHAFIFDTWASKLSAQCPPILYGGSVAPDNFGQVVRVPRVGGALVGGASLVFAKFKQLIDISEQAQDHQV